MEEGMTDPIPNVFLSMIQDNKSKSLTLQLTNQIRINTKDYLKGNIEESNKKPLGERKCCTYCHTTYKGQTCIKDNNTNPKTPPITRQLRKMLQ